MKRQELHDGWRLQATGGPVPPEVAAGCLRVEVPAAVPGGTHLDLLAAGLIEHPYRDRVEADLVWMHRADWRYRTEFTASAAADGERLDLAFDGLDTVATITLNGTVIGATANMHRSYRFDVTALVREGANELVVDFASALAHAEAVEAELGWRDHVYPHPFNVICKMACSFGWDWGPDLQTAGIWRPVRLERWRTARLASVRPLVTVDEDGTGRVAVHVNVERADAEAAITCAATVSGQAAEVVLGPGQTSAVLELAVPDAPLWWPVGYGEQPLADLDVTLDSGDAYHRRVGFRTVAVDTEPDEVGTPFTIVVNGKPVFAKGANWIPDDHFVSRITRERLARRVEQAVAANMNMLRVWGGGIYESEDFYDLCDERGIMVWQDFPFACASYPEEEPIRGEVEAEAREHVARLTPHPSLVLWNGNNENLWGFADWGWPEQLQGKTWGLGYYTELLPAIVAELDPTRPYSTGSPHSPGDLHPNDANHGPRHEWEVWNRVDYVHYRDHIPRFCAEFGFQGPPTMATLTEWLREEPLGKTSPAFLLHQKAEDGNAKLDRGLGEHLPLPEDFADWHWATQLNQARAVRFGIEHFRSWWPRTAGALVWQINDCWPVTSWAAVDSEERPKPLYYALRQVFAPRLLTVQPRDGGLAAIAVNDTDEPWTGELTARRLTFAGEPVAEASFALDVDPRSADRADLPAAVLTGAESDLLVVEAGGVRAVHTFAEDPVLPYDPDALTVTATAVDGGYRVDVAATGFARDIALLADQVAPDAVVDEQLVTLLPGEARAFHVRTAATVDPSALAAAVRSVNALRAGAVRS